MDFNWETLTTVLPGFCMYVGGMVVYCLFVFMFYRRVSKRFIFAAKKEEKKRFLTRFLYGFQYTLISPLVLVAWAAVITLLLLLMQNDIPLATGLLISMALLATIRITAYFNEGLSEDVAKTVPVSLLALFLVNMQIIKLPEFFAKVKQIPAVLDTLVIYFLFIVVLELILRAYAAIAERD
jgi:hypothetical protein